GAAGRPVGRAAHGTPRRIAVEPAGGRDVRVGDAAGRVRRDRAAAGGGAARRGVRPGGAVLRRATGPGGDPAVVRDPRGGGDRGGAAAAAHGAGGGSPGGLAAASAGPSAAENPLPPGPALPHT